MIPLSTFQYQQQFESALPYLRQQAATCPMNMQHIYASYVVVRTAGLVEIGVRDILGVYARRRGSNELQSYVTTMIGRENSLNCDKIEKLLGRFSENWWRDLQAIVPEPQKAAVDSVKTLRDQFAHGRPNGTGFAIIDGYYILCRTFVATMSDFINP